MIASHAAPPSLLVPADGGPVEVVNAGGRGGIVLVCEHASRRMPAALGTMGLGAGARDSHVAWDPGARAVAVALSEALDAPLVAARFSRLVYDCNRPPEHPGAMTAETEQGPVPANRGLAPAARAARVGEVYEPFRTTLAETLDARAPRALVTVHSFTPVYYGRARSVEIGLLHDADDRLARAMRAPLAAATGRDVRLNEPYGPADGVTHTLRAHALPRGLANVMIELRSDLVAEADAQAEMAAALRAALGEAL